MVRNSSSREGGAGFIPGKGTKIPHAARSGGNKSAAAKMRRSQK